MKTMYIYTFSFKIVVEQNDGQIISNWYFHTTVFFNHKFLVVKWETPTDVQTIFLKKEQVLQEEFPHNQMY